jgi:hypothetical protein
VSTFRSLTPSRDSCAEASRPRRVCLIAPLVAAAVMLAGCTGGSSTTGPDGEGATDCGSQTAFNASNFVDPTLDTNPYHPLRPGLQWVRGGSTQVGGREVPYEVITTMTDVIRVIDGVPAIAMLDEQTDSGELSALSIDYFALDREGNVWILGGYTEGYQGGEYTNTEDAWLGSEAGKQVGILSPADVSLDDPSWCIGAVADEEPSVGVLVEDGAQVCVAFGCYDEVRVVQEGEVGAPDNENKSYAPGVGVIKNEPLDASLHKDRFELLNFVELSPAGLTDASDTVLALEAHAAEEGAPELYGAAPTSTRATP